MKLKRLRAENIRSYEELDISFDSGVTVVSGVNGSGKSSLLEACFSGLFGSKTLSTGFVLADMIRKGATNAVLTLEFEQKGRDYVIEQGFRYNSKNDRASNTKSVFKVDGKILVDQATQTYDAVRALLNMDEEAYKNCVYIRQGEVDVLINAKPADRQRMIDDLLQIGKLEEYRGRAGSARVAVGRLQRDTDGRIKDVASEIEKIESTEPVRTLNELKEQLNRIQTKMDDLNKKRDVARSKKDELNAKIADYREKGAKKDAINNDIRDFDTKKDTEFETIEAKKKDILSKRESMQFLMDENSVIEKELGVVGKDIDRVISGKEEDERTVLGTVSDIAKDRAIAEKDIASREETSKDIEKQLADIQGTVQKLAEDIRTTQQEITENTSTVKQLEEKQNDAIEKVKELGFTQDQLDSIDENMDLLTERVKQLHSKEQVLSSRIDKLTDDIKKGKELLAKGLCPTCGQDLKGSIVEETTADDEEQKSMLLTELSDVRGKHAEIKGKVETVKAVKAYGKEIEDYKNEIERIQHRIESSVKRVEDYDSRIAEEEKKTQELRDRRGRLDEDIARIRKEIASLKVREEAGRKDHEAAKDRLYKARKIQANLHEMEKLKIGIEQLEDKIRHSQEKVNLIESQIIERMERLREVEEKLGAYDIKELQELLVRYESAYNNLVREIENLSSEKDGTVEKTGHVKNELKRLLILNDDQKRLKNKLNFLEAVYHDAEALEDMYMRIRADLRARNIGALDALLNEMFSFMYSNNAYSHIKLDSDYNLTVYEKDGIPLEPKLLSGGERAIFNLVLRCAIYRLLALGGSGATRGDGLPPLIFDEPTVFLDRGHVQQLIKLIDMMRDIGVGQILIVSHDESLIDSADHVFLVEKDPITNTSTITAK